MTVPYDTGSAIPLTPPSQLINIDQYGADPTGTADSSAGIIKAQQAGGTSPYLLMGNVNSNYKFGALTDINPFIQNQSISGYGAALTNFTYLGNNTAFKAQLSGTFTGGAYASRFTGFSLSGFSAGGSANGLQVSNLQGANGNDLSINGFGGTGLNLVNTSGDWSEQSNWQARLIQNGAGCTFDTGSFDYSNYDFLIVANANQDGIRLQNAANLQGSQLRIRGNFHTGVTNTGAVIAIDRGNLSGTSFIKFAQCDIAVEADGATLGHFTVLFGSSNSTSQFTNSSGVLGFASGTANFQGVSNPHGVPFGFNGVLHDQALGTMNGGDGGVILGGFDQNQSGALNGNLFSSTIFFNFGDVIAFQLLNGAQTLTFSSLGTWARRVNLYIAQPASGAAGTITWPANVKWPGGTAPTLSATNNFVDHVRMTFLPTPGNWYGELVGAHYA
jgi:hypothetical protein